MSDMQISSERTNVQVCSHLVSLVWYAAILPKLGVYTTQL